MEFPLKALRDIDHNLVVAFLPILSELVNSVYCMND